METEVMIEVVIAITTMAEQIIREDTIEQDSVNCVHQQTTGWVIVTITEQHKTNV